MVSLDEAKYADLGARSVKKFMDTAELDAEREFYMLCRLYVLTIFGDMLFNREEENGSKE